MSTKVFVGNLAFRTTDQALQEAFSECGRVKSGVIITRGRRSLGYGFVEFFSPEDAAASVNKMNGVELFGRQLKVELAKDPAERPAAIEGGESGPAKRRRRTPAPHTSETGSPASGDTGSHDGEGERPPRRRRPRKTNEGSTAESGSGRTSTNEKPKDKVPSKTTLFVANLPFSIDDEQLAKVFASTKMKSAHVVRTRTGRSRGYGFVEFENEADQMDALKSTNGVEVSGVNGNRNISVTVSNSVASTGDSKPSE